MTNSPTRPKWDQFSPTEDAPAVDAVAINLAGDTDLSNTPFRALWVGVSGNVKIKTLAGNIVTFVGVQGVFPVAGTVVYSSGTTATDIAALF